jgi:hypothetical protein
MTKVFISYAHADEFYRKELEKHLSVLARNGYIDTWNDRELIAGQVWGDQISSELEEAQIILLLISSDFLASNYCYDIEMKRAIERHKKQEAIVVPIIIRFCDWSNTPFSLIQGLPLDAKPVRDWPDPDQAFLNVVEGIKTLLNSTDTSRKKPWQGRIAPTPQEILSEIYEKVFLARNERDLLMVKFDLDNYKKIHPITFEFHELEERIKKGIRYETVTNSDDMQLCRERDTLHMKKRSFTSSVIAVTIIVSVIAILVYLIVRLLT